ncbi:MAG: sensor histidine kinase [Bacteroidetes bacterium]|nr:sensor histidine kinase [Bacteroidota bacterium]
MSRIYFFLFCFALALPSFSQGKSDIQQASYYMFRNSDSAFYFSDKAIKEAKDSSDYYYGKFFLGQCVFWQGHIDSSIMYYTSAEKFFSRTKDSLKLLEIYSEKGNALKVISQYDKSYDYLMQALEIAESVDSLRWHAVLDIYLAEHARAMGDKANAFMFIDRAFNVNNIRPLSGDDLAELYHRKAAIEHQFGSAATAEEYSLKSLKVSEATGNLHQQATSYNELGFYYANHRTADVKERDKPLRYYSKAEALWRKLNFKRYYIWVWRNISREYGNDKQYAQSNRLLKDILAVSEPNHWDEVTSDIALQAAENFEVLKNADSALFYYKKYISSRENTEARFKSKEFQDILVKYATLQKEQMLKKQEEETSLAKQEIEKTAEQRNSILLLLAMLLVLFIVIAYLTIILRRKNSLLVERSMKIESINKQLQSELNHKNILFAELHHRVKNNLAVLSGLVSLQKDAVQDESVKEILQDTQNRIYSIAMIHRGLYSLNDSDNIYFDKYIKELSASLIKTYKLQADKIECQVNFPDVPVNINKAVPLALIINELLSNSLKHVFQNSEKGMMGINGRFENGFLHLSVFDDGPGFSADFNNLPSASLGLHLVKILSEQLDAHFHYQYHPGKSEFTFLIPVKK